MSQKRGKRFGRNPKKGTYLCEYCCEPVMGNTYKGLCKKCASVHLDFASIPKPQDKGIVACPYDGFDYKRHECEWRKALATKRFNEGKDYQMPQCRLCPVVELGVLPIRKEVDSDKDEEV